MFCGPAEQVPIPRDCLRTLRAALGRPDGATVLVVGPPGCCKSTAVLCALRDMGDAPLVIDAATERAGALHDALRRAPQALPVVIESAETAVAAISAAVRDAPRRRKPTVLVALACRALAPLRAVATVSIAFPPVPQHNVAIVLARQGAAADADCINSRVTSGDLEFFWSLKVDTLTAVMLVVVTTVSAVVHIYSVGYMHHDDAIPRFFAYLSLFTFSMLMLVTADNLVQLFFGWEGVGLCSYLLIGFWYKRPSANAAAIKAFLVNRVGDLIQAEVVCDEFGDQRLLKAFKCQSASS